MGAARNQYNPNYAIHPGEYLEEVLESREIQKNDFARRAGITPKTVSQIVNGKASFSSGTALQFERVLGISAEIWMSMMSAYLLYDSRDQERQRLESAIAWAKQFPIKDLKKMGYLDARTDGSHLVSSLLSFFGVSSPSAWDVFYRQKAVAFRKSPSIEASMFSVMTWLQIAESSAREVETAPFDEKVLRWAVRNLKTFTAQEPAVFEPQIRSQCAAAGVAVVLVPELTATRISGATEWMSADKVLVALSLRHKSDDHFWFTLFHELGHVLLHGKKPVFIDDNTDAESKEEREANQFARNALVPREAYSAFVRTGHFYKHHIREFAARVGVAPGIVVGMLQHDGLIEFSWHNDLKRRFELT